MALRFPRREAADAWATTVSRWLGVAFLLVGLVNYAVWRTVDGAVLTVGCALVGVSQGFDFFRVLRTPPERTE